MLAVLCCIVLPFMALALLALKQLAVSACCALCCHSWSWLCCWLLCLGSVGLFQWLPCVQLQRWPGTQVLRGVAAGAWPLLQLDAPQLVHVRRPASALNPCLPACLHNFLSTALPQSKVAAFIRRVPGGTVVLNRVDKVSRGGVPGCSSEPQTPTLWRCFWCGWRRGSPSCCRTWMYSTQ